MYTLLLLALATARDSKTFALICKKVKPSKRLQQAQGKSLGRSQNKDFSNEALHNQLWLKSHLIFKMRSNPMQIQRYPRTCSQSIQCCIIENN